MKNRQQLRKHIAEETSLSEDRIEVFKLTSRIHVVVAMPGPTLKSLYFDSDSMSFYYLDRNALATAIEEIKECLKK